MTYGQKSSRLNSRPVYCSRLYGISKVRTHYVQPNISSDLTLFAADFKEMLKIGSLITLFQVELNCLNNFTWKKIYVPNHFYILFQCYKIHFKETYSNIIQFSALWTKKSCLINICFRILCVNILNSFCLGCKGLFMMLISLASCEIPPQQLGSIYQITKSNILPMEFHLQGKKC